jgi:hypothetical protein
MPQRVTVEDRAHFGAAQRKTKVAGLRGVHRVDGKAARLIRCPGKDIEI